MGGWGWINYKSRSDPCSTLLLLTTAAINEWLKVFVSLLITAGHPSSATEVHPSLVASENWI